VDAAVAPGRVPPREPEHQRTDHGRRGWSAAGQYSAVPLGPVSGDQFEAPAQQRRRRDDPTVPPLRSCTDSRRDSASSRSRSCGSSRGRLTCPAQYRNLVTQHEQLDVLGCRATGTKDDKTAHRPNRRVRDRQQHPSHPAEPPSHGSSEVLEPDTLLLRRIQSSAQHLVERLLERLQPRRRALRRPARRRHGARQRRAHRAPMHVMLVSQLTDRQPMTRASRLIAANNSTLDPNRRPLLRSSGR